jgi:lipopolysaccharide/colanic/teichoic acid biosynthesis glycosyltransferase
MQLRLPWLGERLPLLALATWDVAVLMCTYGLVYRLRIGQWWGAPEEAMGLTMGWLSLSYLIGRYSKDSIEQEWHKPWHSKTLKVVAVLLAGVQIHSWVFRVIMEETRFRGFLLPYLILAGLGSAWGQALIKKKVQKNKKQWLILGTKEELKILRREAADKRNSEINIQQMIDSENLEKAEECINLKTLVGVAISRKMLKTKRPPEKLLRARREGLSFCSVESWCEEALQRMPPELFDPDQLLIGDGYSLQPNSISWRIKRLGDILTATPLLLISTPILAAAMLSIKIEDRGPIFYRQRRTGLFGEEIMIIKLRTMKIDAEKHGAVWATRGDQRITKTGHWLRKFRIDEIPQLWLVIKGEMSLIGPRPERPEIEKDLYAKIQNYRLRHWLRPGLSGWAQVCYPYGASVEDSRMKLSYDLYYLRNANPILDLLILLKTIKLVAGAKGYKPNVLRNLARAENSKVLE